MTIGAVSACRNFPEGWYASHTQNIYRGGNTTTDVKQLRTRNSNFTAFANKRNIQCWLPFTELYSETKALNRLKPRHAWCTNLRCQEA